tara:strand:- start:309 stop:488 length:180 start_codon:yes stop_codon:yes gene_type:complete
LILAKQKSVEVFAEKPGPKTDSSQIGAAGGSDGGGGDGGGDGGGGDGDGGGGEGGGGSL